MLQEPGWGCHLHTAQNPVPPRLHVFLLTPGHRTLLRPSLWAGLEMCCRAGRNTEGGPAPAIALLQGLLCSVSQMSLQCDLVLFRKSNLMT